MVKELFAGEGEKEVPGAAIRKERLCFSQNHSSNEYLPARQLEAITSCRIRAFGKFPELHGDAPPAGPLPPRALQNPPYPEKYCASSYPDPWFFAPGSVFRVSTSLNLSGESSWNIWTNPSRVEAYISPVAGIVDAGVHAALNGKRLDHFPGIRVHRHEHLRFAPCNKEPAVFSIHRHSRWPSGECQTGQRDLISSVRESMAIISSLSSRLL